MFNIKAVFDARSNRIKVQWGYANPTGDKKLTLMGDQAGQLLAQVEILLNQMQAHQKQMAQAQMAADPEIQKSLAKIDALKTGTDAHGQWVEQNRLDLERQAQQVNKRPAMPSPAEILKQNRQQVDQVFGPPPKAVRQ